MSVNIQPYSSQYENKKIAHSSIKQSRHYYKTDHMKEMMCSSLITQCDTILKKKNNANGFDEATTLVNINARAFDKFTIRNTHGKS